MPTMPAMEVVLSTSNASYITLTVLGKRMLDQLTLATFAPFVDTVFTVRAGDQAIPLTLRLAAPLKPVAAPPGVNLRAEPFELQFQEPVWSLPQGIHDLEHPTLGTLPIFIVPIGPNVDRTGFLYQAIFN